MLYRIGPDEVGVGVCVRVCVCVYHKIFLSSNIIWRYVFIPGSTQKAFYSVHLFVSVCESLGVFEVRGGLA